MKLLKLYNHDKTVTKKIFNSDKAAKIIFIPLLGMLIPNITGLITNYAYSFPLLFVNYCCFIVLAWLVWEGDVRLMIAVKDSLPVPNKEYRKSLFLLLITIVT